MKKQRLDKLVKLQFPSLTDPKIHALIIAGQVVVNNNILTKPGDPIPITTNISIKPAPKYVSRGGDKLEHALNVFKINVRNKVCVDIGASTGGFTDCLLQYGAKRVYAIDVAYGKLDIKLRNNKSVVNIEKNNARYFDSNKLYEICQNKNIEFLQPHLATIDVSFISLTKILNAAKDMILPGGIIIALIKPQFEAMPKYLRKGVVLDENIQNAVVNDIKTFAEKLGLNTIDICKSPIKGAKGNTEYFIYL